MNLNNTGALQVVKALEAEGVALAFGIPGTHNIELYDALGQSQVRPVLVTDEQSASFMADGAWRASGKLAAINVVPGAGLTHALSGIAEAFLDQIPLLVLGCGIRRDTGKAYQLHDIDQQALVRPVVKGTFRPTSHGEIYSSIRKACALAKRPPYGPVFVEIPAELYLKNGEGNDHFQPEIAQTIFDEGAFAAALEQLRSAKRPFIYVGAGALGLTDHLIRLAETLEAPVATTIQGKGVFPENHPLFIWNGFGRTVPPDLRKLIEECDLTLALGCRFAEVATGSYAGEPPGMLIHFDIDPSVFGKNFKTAVAVEADLSRALPELTRALQQKPRTPEIRSRIAAAHQAIQAGWEQSAAQTTGAVSPARLLAALPRHFGKDTIYVADSGNGLFLAMEHLRLSEPRKFLGPVDYSCMGYSVPATIGAKLARPDCPVVGLIGDGAFLMTGFEIITAATLNQQAIFLVLRDRELAQIAQFQSVALSRKTCTILPPYDLEAFARATGAAFYRLSDNREIDALLAALAQLRTGQPVLVEVAIDYSHKTFFTQGVVKANFGRLPLTDQFRFVARAVTRKVTG